MARALQREAVEALRMQIGSASLHAGPALRMEVRPYLAMHPSPVLLAITAMLPLTSQELDDAIDREGAENPALDRVEADSCPICDGDPDRRCPRCRPRSLLMGDRVRATLSDGPEAAGCPTPQETLLAEVRLVLSHKDLPVAEFVVGSLDERGFLPEGAIGVARLLGMEESRVERVLHALREVGPPGIGARDARDCLLLQIDRLELERSHSGADGEAPLRAMAKAIVSGQLEALARGRFASIARALGASLEEVEAARQFIRTRLSPHPSSGLPGDRGLPPMLPDVVVREPPGRPGELEVEVVDERRFVLRIDPLYRLLADKAATNHGNGVLTPEVRRHVREAVRRAAFFISCLEDRNRTLRRIAVHTVEAQRAFVLRGPGSLRRLTRAQVAGAIGVHESTVSRATAGKHVMLPSGKVVPFRDFFDPSLGVQDALRRLVQGEDRALSDRELTDRLRDLGYRVARRTVAKYRTRLGLLPRTLRAAGRTKTALA